jgi:hypothetical protein
MRDSTIFYRSFYEAICNLEPHIQAQVYNAIFEYSLNFNEIKLEGIAKTIFTLIKPQIDANIDRYKRGCLPKQKLNESKTEAKQKQVISKTEANVNDNVNENIITNVIKKPRKISFEDSELFDKVKFKETFNEWSTDKLRHYYDAALRYSIEGNKYVSWKLAIEAWERKDKNNNVKFEPEKQKVIIW